MPWETAEILGVRIASIDQPALIDQALRWGIAQERRIIAYVNANSLNIAQELPGYKACLERFDLVYADGIGIVWAGKLLGTPLLHKVTGRAWIDEFSAQAARVGARIFLLGGKPGVAARAADVLRQRFPGLVISGAADGFFSDRTEPEIIQELNASPPHILLVGMGTPAQELWVTQNDHRLPAMVCWSVGALFDYLAGSERPVPAWLEKLGLEWLWRLGMDPCGKWRRYLIGIPRYIGRILHQKFSSQE